MKNEHRSCEHKLCNCVREAWKKNSRLQWDLNPWLRDTGAVLWPTKLWSHWCWELVNYLFICSCERDECDKCIWNKYMWTAEMKSSEEWSLLTKPLELFDRWKRTKDSLQPTKKFYDNSFIENSAMSLSTWIWDFSRQGWTNSVQTVFKGKFFYWCEMCYMQSWPCSLARQALFFVEEWHITRRLLCFLFRWLHYWGLSNIEKLF